MTAYMVVIISTTGWDHISIAEAFVPTTCQRNRLDSCGSLEGRLFWAEESSTPTGNGRRRLDCCVYCPVAGRSRGHLAYQAEQV